MAKIAILGFGVVGGGVCDLIVKNAREIERLCGETVTVKRILDLRDFPGSPFAEAVTHNYDDIANDAEISCVIELMGGIHPAYEYTLRALRAGKHVITSNKAVVAECGVEFMKVARENGVTYRFEAAVGGGIPVISPIISLMRQNKISEIRGILNGTTNYILTKMFDFGASFETALSEAQSLGYAERNPDADVLGTDAARKISILGALESGKLVPPHAIHTEGITKIRREDVLAAEKIGATVKLFGRYIVTSDGDPLMMVAPFMIDKSAPLASVHGVYNAVELLGEPIGNVMFFGRGAGAGPTASAVVGDLMQIIKTGTAYAEPSFEKESFAGDFAAFRSESYVAAEGADAELIRKIFGKVRYIEGDECAFITDELSEFETERALQRMKDSGAKILSRIRILK